MKYAEIRSMAAASTIAMFAVSISIATAFAATLTNRDAVSHKLVVVEDGKRTEHVIEASQSLSGLCAAACELFISDDPDPWEILAADNATIQGGLLKLPDDQSSGDAQTKQ